MVEANAGGVVTLTLNLTVPEARAFVAWLVRMSADERGDVLNRALLALERVGVGH